jgi:hypothetical protein
MWYEHNHLKITKRFIIELTDLIENYFNQDNNQILLHRLTYWDIDINQYYHNHQPKHGIDHLIFFNTSYHNSLIISENNIQQQQLTITNHPLFNLHQQQLIFNNTIIINLPRTIEFYTHQSNPYYPLATYNYQHQPIDEFLPSHTFTEIITNLAHQALPSTPGCPGISQPPTPPTINHKQLSKSPTKTKEQQKGVTNI